MDGSIQTAWLVLDYFDVVIHIMRRDLRERYNLEGLWNDAPRVKTSAPRKHAAGRSKQSKTEAGTL